MSLQEHVQRNLNWLPPNIAPCVTEFLKQQQLPMSHGGCYQTELPLGRRYDDDDNEEEEAGGCGEGEGKGGREVGGEEEEKRKKDAKKQTNS